MTDITQSPPDWWIAALEKSEAEIAAGHTVPLEPVLERLRQSIARMEARAALVAKEDKRRA